MKFYCYRDKNQHSKCWTHKQAKVIKVGDKKVIKLSDKQIVPEDELIKPSENQDICLDKEHVWLLTQCQPCKNLQLSIK